ncbi:MAG: HEAT repeat domain-containing protein [Cyclobacteriaceae bacterium]|nr:HEAT repeat domain-containing protein [Cyclobacteriaceae bacterium]MCB9238846.1 HEAT repeat domain-containing protein [Flammeovirgaceae bacterium]MCB0498122.1 HEAT repeat domain-containing protein [Cyclobacteriaceae bacterium]MCO5270565.1 HEAT repeat domain-containing protein [Cyclobacteriaceae bacterium]MCW5900994.1 HEAT repeat domain-containing protein [Cyclobacteriaceae bacterium]
MEKNEVKELIERYNQGLAAPGDILKLEQLIEEGRVLPTALRDLSQLEERIMAFPDPAPSMQQDARFYAMLKEEKGKARKGTFLLRLPQWNVLAPRLAFALVLLIAGFTGGYLVNRPHEKSVDSLTREVTGLKEMVMLSLLEKESATDRLKAVGLTSEMAQASKKVTAALIQALNEDGNVNVRLAALDALRPYVQDSSVRESLIKSIANQGSPMVQVALADLMVALHEKKSVKELRKLLQEEATPKEIKERIEESIQVLI